MKTKHHRFLAATAAFLAALAAAVLLAQRSAARGVDGCENGSAGTARSAEPNPELRALVARAIRGDAVATFSFARGLELGFWAAPDPDEAAYWYGVAEEQGYDLPDDVVERLFP